MRYIKKSVKGFESNGRFRHLNIESARKRDWRLASRLNINAAMKELRHA